MATRTRNGNGNLQEAMTLLIQNQASFVRDMSEIRKEFEQIKGYMIRLEHLLANLPEAIREKIGFKAK